MFRTNEKLSDRNLKIISVFRPSNGVWYRINSANNSFSAIQFGLSTDRIAPADYDGDRKTDIAVFRQTLTNPYLAYFYILNSSNGALRVEQFGEAGDSPVPGDWDGDGKADIAVYTQLLGIPEAPPPPGFFSYRPSSNPSGSKVTIGVNPGGISVPGDYDGDGKQDAGVFTYTGGIWLIRQSSNNTLRTVQFGLNSDKPVPADYDGDSKTDIAVFRSGTWYILNSSNNRFTGVQFGFATDKPVPADYDGDGNADIAVYRDGTWFLLRSSAGFTAVQFGFPTDVPVPTAYLWQY
ncbi:MAG: VCBS repeat-containing protein [Acidobacteria bacterium]|nr:VCBS repeat-containing protein [Acidobacteriota bacterium]